MSLLDTQKTLLEILLKEKGENLLDNQEVWEGYINQDASRHFLKKMNPDKIKLYQKLIRTSVQEILNDIFPYTKKLIETAGVSWPDMVEIYRRQFPNRSFQLYTSCEGFPQFIQGQEAFLKAYPFLADLAWYEWAEVKIMNMEPVTLPCSTIDKLPVSLEAYQRLTPLINPISIIQTLQYNIPKVIDILKQGNPTTVEPSSTHIIIYKDQLNKIRFFILQEIPFQLLKLCCQPLVYQDIFAELFTQESLAQSNPEVVLTEAVNILKKFYENNILIGSIWVD